MAEEPAGQQMRLKEELGVPRRRRVLHLSFARPAMSGRDYEGPGWKLFSYLHVYLGGSKVASLPLPDMEGGLEAWWRPFELPMDWEWPRLCLCLEAVREDFGLDNRMGRLVVFRTEEPHTSGYTAVIGAAMVPLLDALVLGDDEEEGEKAVEKKRQLEEELNSGDAGGEQTNVVGGSVVVVMYMSEEEDDGPAW